MNSTLLIPFPGSGPTTLAEVGGKGHSLIRMVDSGLPVPPGAVLAASFFSPWFDEIKASATWSALTDAPPDEWATLCDELKALCPALPLTAPQRQTLEELRTRLAANGADALFAVRSSSPEEDLASASFAGGYETRLGVRPVDLEDALRHCFASALDERVLVYKKEHGFDTLSPRIAVVVQEQIDSEVAGVAFSINPLTNDYDEAVIDANWGQGESVVAGLVSPDHFIVDKVSRRVVEKNLGSKQVSIWLDSAGGTSERSEHRSAESTLDNTQIDELTDAICRIETLYEFPVDIEWAYADGHLHVLQARPVTAYVPLPPEMTTEPGARRRVYTDIALTSGFTINAPISPMGLDWIEESVSIMAELFLGRLNLHLTFEQAFWFFAGSRMYQNLSNAMWLMSPQKMGKATVASDPLMAETLINIDAELYRATTRPPWARFRMLRFGPRVLWRLRGVLWNTTYALLAPERAHRAYRKKVDAFEADFIARIDDSLPLDEFRRTYLARAMRHVVGVTMPALAAGLTGLGMVDRVVGRKKCAETRALAERLKVGFPDNAVAEMGIRFHRLARRLNRCDFEDLSRLAERIEEREMPAAFLSDWDAFLRVYGCRGPLEMDLASPRYADDPLLALRQMSFMTGDDTGCDPEAAQIRLVAERRHAYDALMGQSGWLRRAMLRRLHTIIDLFAGTRDTPKQHNLMLHQAVRTRVLTEGRRLADEGRLDVPEHIFDMTFSDITRATEDSSLDLRAIREERTRFLEVLRAQVKQFPGVIDSRGRILRPPPRRERPGTLSGIGLSPGVATGPVKVLHDPHEKSVDSGDVLVAYTTDPGWTPLFTNAAAVVLELGGVLQHGAVVAREYGKPCVAGIDRVMTKLHDGQTVEVDGTTGVIRIVS